MRKPTTSPLHLSSSSHFIPRTLPKLPSHPTPKPLSPQFLCSQSPNPNPNKTLTLISALRTIPDWADEIKESGFRRNRSLYNHQKWLEHRSSLRHVRHLLSSLSSRVILSLIPPVIAFTSFAVFIAAYNTSVSLHWLPEFFPVLRASSLPYQLTAPALALLLVFRTEASYSRFEEGRKAWMRVVAGTNEFASQVVAGVKSSKDAGLKKALLQYVMAFPVALKCHVIYGSDINQGLQNLLEEGDLSVVLSSKHRPRCVIEFISQSLRLLHLDESKLQLLVGVLIEEPFPMLALDELCNLVHESIREAIAMENLVQGQLLSKQNIHSNGCSANGRPNS
ncbi:voltage-dependent chloride channel 1, chloroplastic-like isoform X2 [Tasmannia lanceolata]|uniref:voltage-dependent chloride channel 1, chloroplastic-like isoform X2 n=1 Tax=Tasmannia lanceolata TaxID=3420 RepID=UPI0040631FD5